MTNSQFLRRKILLVSAETDRVNEAFGSHPRLAELFPDLLFRIHSVIRASVPLMEEAVTTARALAADDPVAAGVAAYLEKHIPEERNHDEWLLEDLEALGYSRDQIEARQPSPSVAEAVGAQYYWIRHFHPAALLGYIAVLEGDPPEVEALEKLRAKTGLPAAAFRTLIKHAHLDPHHKDDLDAVLDRLPLEARHHALIGISALRTVDLLNRSVQEILERDPGARAVAAG